MSYKAIYRTYRPKSFEDVVGQDAIVETLQHAITSNKIAHAYLFCGPAGTGKTSVAKLLAKAINCQSEQLPIPCNQCASCVACDNDSNADIIEIDAASNNGVDQIRDIIDQVKYPPMNSKYKVYIIDEVHMLSAGAFNALLKTLEEPPSYVVFILATTEPHKVIPTIISRCQRYDFRKVDNHDMEKRLRYIIAKENIDIDDNALVAIMSLASGGVRSCLSILDQCVAYTQGKVTIDTVTEVYGLTSIETKLDLIDGLKHKDVAKTLALIDQLNQKGVDFKRLILDILQLYKDAVAYLYTSDLSLMTLCIQEQIESLTHHMLAKQFLDSIDIWLKTNNDLRFGNDVVSYFEIACLKNMEVFDGNTVQSNYEQSVTHNKTSINAVYPPQQQPVATIKEENVSRETVPTVTDINEDVVIESTSSKSISAQSSASEQEKDDTPKQEIKSLNNQSKHGEVYDNDYLMGLLVQAQRTCKQEDEEHFTHLNEYRIDLRSGKIVALLQQCQVYASGERFLIVDSMYGDIVEQINEFETNYEIQKLYQKAFFVEKKIVAIDHAHGLKLRNIFRDLAQQKALPKPIEIKLISDQAYASPTEKKLKELFKDKLIIKEE